MQLASQEIIERMNQQIGNELAASVQYIGVAAYFDAEALPQLARFFYRQSEEEREHAMRFVKFVLDVDGKLEVPAIPQMSGDFASAEEAVASAVANEEEVTRQIYELVEIAREEKNYIGERFLDWFVDEQLEEVTTMTSLLQVIRRAGPGGLLHVEDYLARTSSTLESPAQTAG